ncbi:MAG: AMP-binding protein [Planctomycetia bacterium]|nr:AMP-binding protein [Planctomycetia bacterium]
MSLNLALDFQVAAEKFRELPAIICNEVEISYAELANEIRHWVVMLSHLGLKRGDYAALLMPNVPEFTISYFALMHLGVVIVPCNTLLTDRELAYQIHHSDAKYIIAHMDCVVNALMACRGTDTCMGVIIPGTKEDGISQIPVEYRRDPMFWVQDEMSRISRGQKLRQASVLRQEEESEEREPIFSGKKEEHEPEDWQDFEKIDLENSPWPVGALDEMTATYVSRYTRMNSVESEEIFREKDIFRPSQEYVSEENSLYCETCPVSQEKGVLLCPSPAATDPGDTAVILYTSGTTGFPKGAMLSQFNLYSNSKFVREHVTHYKPGSRALAILPLSHSFGQTVVQNAALLAGATLVLAPRFDPKRILQVIETHAVNVLPAVPTMLIHLARMQQKIRADVSSLQLLISGGQSISTEVFHEVQRVFSQAVLIEGYGLSETSPLATVSLPSLPIKPGSVGQEIMGCQVRIMREDHTFAQDGEIGELVMRGHNVMRGYHKDLLATQQVFTNAWLHTGDIGYRDEDGYFYIVDRKKDIIIRAGMNIYPREIEEVLYGHPDVYEAAVIGIPHPLHGEDVIAYISLNPGCEEEEQEFLKYCRLRLAAYKCPRKINIIPQLPKGSTGKIIKRDLVKQAKGESF